MLCSVLKSYVSEEDAVSFRVEQLISNTIKQNIHIHKVHFLQLLMRSSKLLAAILYTERSVGTQSNECLQTAAVTV